MPRSAIFWSLTAVWTLAVGPTALAKVKKKPKTPAAAAAPAPETLSARLWIYQVDHPTGPPDVLIVDGVEPKIPGTPLLKLSLGSGTRDAENAEPEDVSVTEKDVTPDQGKGVKRVKSPKKLPSP